MLCGNTGPVLYSTVGTTLSMLNGNEDLYLPSVIEATIAGKAGDLQPNLWVIGQNSSNLTSMDSFYSSPGRGFNSHGESQKEGYTLRWAADSISSEVLLHKLINGWYGHRNPQGSRFAHEYIVAMSRHHTC